MEAIMVMFGVIAFQGVNPAAQNALARAYYSHSQGEAYVNDRLHYYDGQVSDSLKTKVGAAAFLYKTISEQHVSVSWTFP